MPADKLVANGKARYGTSLHRLQVEAASERDVVEVLAGDLSDSLRACDAKELPELQKLAKGKKVGELVEVSPGELKKLVAAVVAKG